MFRYLNIFVLLVLLSSCGESDEKRSFVSHARTTPSDLVDLMEEGESQEFVEKFLTLMPKPIENSLWVNNGYVPAQNLSLNIAPDSYDYVSIGEDPKKGLHLTSTPMSANGLIFTLGGQGEVQARVANNPEKIVWEQIVDQEDLSQKKHGFMRSITGVFYDSESFLGGNICYTSDIVFVTTKRGNVYALDGKDGKVIWTRKIGIPVRSAPAASGNTLIVTSTANKTYALNAKTGDTIWVHEGLAEKSKLASSPAPLIHKGKVILTYSSGEVYQLNIETGKEVWNAITSPTVIKVLNPSINDIGFSPIYHKGRILVVTSDGRLIGLDYATGNTLFEFEGYSIYKPVWVVSDSIFAVTKYGRLIAISITSGQLVWESQMDDPEEIHDDKIKYTGPVMAEGLIYIATNEGELRAYSPKDGSLVTEYDIPSGVLLSPIVVNGKMFMITSDDPKLIYFE